jgi:glycerol kinase
MHKPLILAIDQGGQSTRVAIYNLNGEQLHCFSSLCATHTFSPEHSNHTYIEQDGEAMLAGIRECLQKITVALGSDIQYLSCAGFAGQGSSLLCWDNITGVALTPVLSWQDIRGKSLLNSISLTHEQVQKISGLRISPHYGASKMRWCINNHSMVHDALINHRLSIGPIVSYLFWHLLQHKNVVDPGHAQRTLLWNLHNNYWDDVLLKIFDIPKSVLPECQYHDSLFGFLSLNQRNIPFTVSARDQGASLFARGLPEVDACYINIGTGAFVQRLSYSLHAPQGLLVSPLWLPENPAAKKYYAWEATVNGAASAVSFMKEQTGLDVTPEQINKALSLTPKQACYFLNAVGGLSAPYWRTDLTSTFSENLLPEEKILAWLESIIFQLAVNIELMGSLGQLQKIYVSGGLSNADALCQKISDLIQVPVIRSENTDATLQGIAYLAAAMPKTWSVSAPQEIFLPCYNQELSWRFDAWKIAIDRWLDSENLQAIH